MNKKQKYALILEQHPVLYHGTDARIIAMDEQQRSELFLSCKEVIRLLWEHFGPLVTGEGKIDNFRSKYETEEEYRQFTLAASMCYHMRERNNPLFGHEALYLTSIESSARKYAQRAGYFGEIGFVAYTMIEAARHTKNMKLLPESLYEPIARFAEAEHEPAVISVTRYDPSLLKTELGDEIEIIRGVVRGSDFRYLGTLDLTQYPMTK